MSVVPVQVGPYRILDRLGTGGMGEVFLAEDTRLGRRVALKTLSNSGNRPAEARHNLLREARAAAHLNHPNIAAVYDVIDSGDDAHIVMEYVDGETLAARLQRGPLPVADAVDIGLQLADAVTDAHAAGIVHRDLKPANICLTRSGRVKILDFGLARSQVFDLSSATGPIESGSGQRPIVGTPQYIPPEHLLGGTADERGDIYSLGVTLFEMLAGSRPFGGADLVSLVAEVLHAPMPRLVERRRDVPPRLDALVGRAMARLPSDRFASARELLAEMRLVADEITHPDVSSVVTLPPPPPAVTRPSWLVAAVGLLVIAGAAGTAWRLSAQAPAVPGAPIVVAVLPFSSGGGSSDTLGAGVSDLLTTSLARTAGITVIARAAVSEGRGDTPVEKARGLGATHVVDGRVQESGVRIRLSAQLVRVDTGTVAWAGTWEGDRADVLELERGLADEVARAVAPGARPGPEPLPTRDTDAFADFSQGWSFLDRPDVEGNVQRAVDAFTRAIRRDPAFVQAHAGRGHALLRLYEQTRDPVLADQASAALTEALRLEPQDPAVRLALAGVYSRTGRRGDALAELQRALVAQPTLDEGWALRGELLAEAGDVDDGVAAFQEAIRLRPSLWRHHLGLGTVLFRAGRYPLALVRFTRATELQPDAAWGHQMVGTTHHAMGNLEAAVAAYLRATAAGADEKAWDNLGTAYYQQGRFDDALAAYRRSAEIQPRSIYTHHNLGDLYLRLRRPPDSRRSYEVALRLAREALDVDGTEPRTAALAALLLAKLQRHAEASDQLRAALSLAPADGEVLHYAAVVHALAGRSAEGVAALEGAVAKGYSRSVLREDEFLGNLRTHSRFAALLGEPFSTGGRP